MKAPAFQFYPSDWLSSRAVRLMDAEQRGWYIQLLAESWESEPQGTLPNDDALLRVLAGANTCSTDVAERWDFVIKQFKKRGQLVYNERLMDEVVRQEENRQKKREAGKASAEARQQQREAFKTQHLTTKRHRNRRSTPVQQVYQQNGNTTSTEGQQNSTLLSSSSSSLPIPLIEKEKHKSIVVPASPDTTGEKDSRSRSAQAGEIFEYWKRERGRNHQTIFDDKRKRAVEARLKAGYDVDFIKQAIRGIKHDPHCMGENDAKKIYDDLELICRDSTHLEGYAALDVGNIPARASPVPRPCAHCSGKGVAMAYSIELDKEIEQTCFSCKGEKVRAG